MKMLVCLLALGLLVGCGPSEAQRNFYEREERKHDIESERLSREVQGFRAKEEIRRQEARDPKKWDEYKIAWENEAVKWQKASDEWDDSEGAEMIIMIDALVDLYWELQDWDLEKRDTTLILDRILFQEYHDTFKKTHLKFKKAHADFLETQR